MGEGDLVERGGGHFGKGDGEGDGKVGKVGKVGNIHAKKSGNADLDGGADPHVIQQWFARIVLYSSHDARKNMRIKTIGTKRTAMLILVPKSIQKI